MAQAISQGTSSSCAAQLFKDLQILEHTNTLLSEEAGIAKAALKTALDKLGFDWSPASRDYSIMRRVLSVASLPELEESLQLSEERRVSALHSIVQLRNSVTDLMGDRNEILAALAKQFISQSYRCRHLEKPAIAIWSELGTALWFIEQADEHLFDFLPLREVPSRILTDSERKLALSFLD